MKRRCSLLKVLAAATVAAAGLGVAAPASAATIVPGLYRLHDHPDGNMAPPTYGLRLDELFNVTGSSDEFTFSFDQPGTGVFLDYDGTSIHIFGRAFGGLDAGSAWNPAWTSFLDIDFTYSMTSLAAGDDDVIVAGAHVGSGSGTVEWVDIGQSFSLTDKPNNEGYSFRFGDEDNDLGHRGFPGISGWGWLRINGQNLGGAQDWLFTAVLIPLPAPVWMGLAGLAGVAIVRRRRKKTAA